MAAASPPPSPPCPSKRPRLSPSVTTTSDAEDTADPVAGGSAPGESQRRYKRRKVAIFLGYCGAGYQGMQKNPGARTIEGDLEEALFLAGAVPEADRGLSRRYEWARSARTDKGVSAAAQVVSGCFFVDQPGFIARLNSHLPDQIRVFGYKRATKSFNAKKFCDRRRYVYLLPVIALDPSAHLGSTNELTRCLECSERGFKVPGLMGRRSEENGDEEKPDLSAAPAVGEAGGETILNLEDERKDLGNGQLESVNETKRFDLGSSVHGKEECTVFLANSEIQDSSNQCRNGNIVSADNSNLESLPDSASSKGQVLGDSGNVVLPVEDRIEDKIAGVEEQVVESGSPKDSENGERISSKFRFSYGENEKKRFNRILKHYEGTHNFHNFTTRTKAEDPSAHRFIISFRADNLLTIEGIEFIKCEVVGQSFMLHQIRKMIGFAVAVMRNCAPESLIDVALKKDVNINAPMAPEVGLYLDECLFTSYNKKWKNSHEPLTMEAYAEEAEEHKQKYIYSHIASMEHKEGAVALWLHYLNHSNYPDFRYMETNGKIVDVAKVENSGV